ncbi:uncharacterized protein BHQ10_009741 [Talaromyces amestolkiae]|uniref:RING-type domain-containing protein n=1 Tax=Talaromyces amestolkiae TaxID=1196081 RepID=A0A364LD76_TALAM|nr:uncharacterized protein BHQ10_009741 [Talaromyces amestolkiae]RAO73729.1 hypothetical protein BHQ10_009741 [Talaromyces amestolkiae]
MSPSVPRFTSPLRNDRRGSPNVKDAASTTGSNGLGAANSLNPTDITTARTNSSRPNTPKSATINEALRNNPFGSTSRARALEAEAQAISLFENEERRADLEDRNRSLVILAALFPDVRVEVFRELLTRFDGKSRLHVCVEQLLRHKKQWVQGRWNIPNDGNGDRNNIVGHLSSADSDALVPPEELFRSETYRNTVKAALCKEFSGLSRSTIDGVLAEVNFSYTRARPTLKELSRKGWRATISNLNPFRRKKDNNKDENPLIIWERNRDGDGATLLIPRLRQKTGSDELDQEIQETFIVPLLRDQKESQEYQDYIFASEINEKDAIAENALYECQCCLDDVTFEQVSACSSDQGHMICFNCIRRTLHEAVFGQGWDNSVDPERSTLKCVAPVSHGVCEGHLDSILVKRAILSEKAGSETYRKFEDRVASEALLKSTLKLDGAGRNIFPPGRDDENNAAEAEADEGESGYKHFCEHFRVNPGTRCTECNKCELYFAEDDEVIARKAGEQAEREWRLRQSMTIANNNNINMNNNNNINQIPQPGKQIPKTFPLRWEDQQSQKHTELYRIPTMYNHHNGSWQYWLIEVWKEGRWKWEIQTMADKLVERVVVIVDIS